MRASSCSPETNRIILSRFSNFGKTTFFLKQSNTHAQISKKYKFAKTLFSYSNRHVGKPDLISIETNASFD